MRGGAQIPLHFLFSDPGNSSATKKGFDVTMTAVYYTVLCSPDRTSVTISLLAS
jgi:hypothetical protein